MRRPDEYARILLAKARDDAQIVRRARDDSGIADWIVGFHAQQAAEKALKAVLSKREIEYPHTHSLKWLLQLIRDSKLQMPPHADSMPELSQFASDIRYGASRDFTPAETIDRAWALACVERTLERAALQLESSR